MKNKEDIINKIGFSLLSIIIIFFSIIIGANDKPFRSIPKFNIKGITKDISPNLIPSTHAYEIRNLRITNTGDTDYLILETEKGNKEYVLYNYSGETDTIEGEIIGYCNNERYIILFTKKETSARHVNDYIYRLERKDDEEPSLEIKKLYEGNLGFDAENILIEAQLNYEKEDVIKLYWIDGVHQPRLLNIMASDEEIAIWENKTNPFDFVPLLQLKEDVSIVKGSGTGLFPSGTIQYIMTYFNKYGQESSVFYQSPIYYLSSSGFGDAADTQANCHFVININNIDQNYDYIRIYSVQRQSINGTPVCKVVRDVKIDTLSKEIIKKDEYIGHQIDDSLGDLINNIPQTQDEWFEVAEQSGSTHKKIQKECFIGNKSIRYDIISYQYQIYGAAPAVGSDSSTTNSDGWYVSPTDTKLYNIYIHTGKYYNGNEIIIIYTPNIRYDDAVTSIPREGDTKRGTAKISITEQYTNNINDYITLYVGLETYDDTVTPPLVSYAKHYGYITTNDNYGIEEEVKKTQGEDTPAVDEYNEEARKMAEAPEYNAEMDSAFAEPDPEAVTTVLKESVDIQEAPQINEALKPSDKITVNPVNEVHINTVNSVGEVDTASPKAGIKSMKDMQEFMEENPEPKVKKKKIKKIIENFVVTSKQYNEDAKGIADDVEKFNNYLYKEKRSAKDKQNMWVLLDSATKKISLKTELEQISILKNIRKFIKGYGFLIQATAYENIELHKRYNFLTYLINEIHISGGGNNFDIADKITVSNFRQEKIGEYTTELNSKPKVMIKKPKPVTIEEEQRKRLSQIIEELNTLYNKHYGVNFATKAAMQIRDLLLETADLKEKLTEEF